MTRQLVTKWKALVQQCSDDFDWDISGRAFAQRSAGGIDREINRTMSSGRLVILGHSKVTVTTYAQLGGIVIRRFPIPFLMGTLAIAWSSISTVIEYKSKVTDEFPNQTDAKVFLKFEDVPPLILPWNHNFNEYLLDSTAYEDRRSEMWPDHEK